MTKAIIFALEPSRPHAYGGSLRTQAAADALRHLGYLVSVVAPSTSIPLGARLQHGVAGRLKRHFLPMPTRFGARTPELRRLADAVGPVEVAICQSFQQAPYLFDVEAEIRWLDFGDLHSEFGRKEATHRRGLARATAAGQAQSLARRETKIAQRADIVTCAGYGDAKILESRGVAAAWLPTPVDGTWIPRRSQTGTVRVGFIGNFDYWPNVEAYDLLRHSWLPRWGTDVEVWVAGHGSTSLPQRDRAHLLGSVERLSDFYTEVDVIAAPVRRGGGIKVKVVEALKHNRPVIASPEALEGFPPPIRELCLATDGDIPNTAELRALAERPLPLADLECLSSAANLNHTKLLLGRAKHDS